MVEDKKTTYPMLPFGHWWTLRKKFKQSIPGVVTDSYLATVLNMGANSARANVLPYLKTLGIIDEEGKTGERAKRWRDDVHYPDVCREILSEVYPAELLEAVPDPVNNRNEAERWFAHKTGAGHAAVARMAVLYQVISSADASKQPEREKAERQAKGIKNHEAKKARPPRRGAALARPQAPPVDPLPPSQSQVSVPGVHINLEVHISADSTPDQIDAIFSSMAKHIYKRG